MRNIERLLWGVVFCGALLLMLRQPYTPTEPVEIAVRFIELVRKHDFAAAHGMTTRGGSVGASVEEFQRRIEHEGLGRVATDSHVEMRLNRISPFQSYGNRARRFLMRRGADPVQYSIDHVLTISGAGVRPQILPFEVRLVRGADDLWRIDFFQIHAM